MQKIEVVKKVVTTIVSIGTAKVIKGIIESNVPTETTFDKVTVTAASAAIGGAVGELSSEYTDAKIDEAVDFMKKLRRKKPNLKAVK